jgi:hypothetical protein
MRPGQINQPALAHPGVTLGPMCAPQGAQRAKSIGQHSTPALKTASSAIESVAPRWGGGCIVKHPPHTLCHLYNLYHTFLFIHPYYLSSSGVDVMNAKEGVCIATALKNSKIISSLAALSGSGVLSQNGRQHKSRWNMYQHSVCILNLIFVLSLITLNVSKSEQCAVLHTTICQVH